LNVRAKYASTYFRHWLTTENSGFPHTMRHRYATMKSSGTRKTIILNAVAVETRFNRSANKALSKFCLFVYRSALMAEYVNIWYILEISYS
jgi:hypothetical protein